MNRLKDLILEIRIEIARRRFVNSQSSKRGDSYDLMNRYFHLCGLRSDSEVKRREARFM